MILTEIREWTMLLLEAGILLVIIMEYNYDRDKDLAKAHKRTKSTKRTTTTKDGSTIVEDSQETIEPMEDKQK